MTSRLSTDYEREYAALLEAIQRDRGIQPRELTMFWPKIGRQYDGDLLVVGRSVNGWFDRWDLDLYTSPRELAALARRTGEGLENGDQLGWVLGRWKNRDGGYDTSTSQFWQTIRRVVLGLVGQDETDWPSRIAWSNVTKVAPWRSGNPGSPLLALQLAMGPALLAREVDELQPRRVLALTGSWWFRPFAEALGFSVDWRSGLVEGVGGRHGRRLVVAVHPMTRSPRAVAEAVLAAFDAA